jgi:hypothetical protein
MTERTEIVAWLRREADRSDIRAADRDVCSGSDVRLIAYLEQKVDWSRKVADAIERGEHLEPPQ